MTINKNSPIPYYYQLAEYLKSQILTGELQPGNQLASERDLSEDLGISRMTVRQAIGTLIDQGLLVTQKGVGTFVAEPKLNHDMLQLRGFTEEMRQYGKQKISSKILEINPVAAPASVAKSLLLESNQQAIKIVRLRLYDYKPLLLESIYVPERLCPGLENLDLRSTSLYKVLEDEYGLHYTYAEQMLESTTANEYESSLLGIAPGTAMILVEGITYMENGQPLEYFKSVYRGDRFRFKLKSQRSSVGNNHSTSQLVAAGLEYVRD